MIRVIYIPTDGKIRIANCMPNDDEIKEFLGIRAGRDHVFTPVTFSQDAFYRMFPSIPQGNKCRLLLHNVGGKENKLSRKISGESWRGNMLIIVEYRND